METTTTTETTPVAEQWAQAAAASAETTTTQKTSAKPPRCFSEKITCKLSDTDIVRISDEIVQADEEASELEDERKSVNDGFKARISLAEQRRADLIAKVRSKTELREVEVIEEFLFSTNTVRVSRADTKEVLRERAMTSNERQEELPLSDPAPVDRTADTEPPPPAEDGTDITDPQAALDGSDPDAKPAKKTTKRKRKP